HRAEAVAGTPRRRPAFSICCSPCPCPDFPGSRGFFLPPTYPSHATSIAVIALAAGLGFLLWRGTWLVRRETLAVLALWGSVYLVIATGRANMYAVFKIAPQRAAIMGRYHYAGTIPLAV